MIAISPGIDLGDARPASEFGLRKGYPNAFARIRFEPERTADILRATATVEEDTSWRMEAAIPCGQRRREHAIARIVRILVRYAFLRRINKLIPNDETEREERAALPEELLERHFRPGRHVRLVQGTRSREARGVAEQRMIAQARYIVFAEIAQQCQIDRDAERGCSSIPNT